MKVHLGINRKMPKGYNEFIQYITTLISTSTNILCFTYSLSSWNFRGLSTSNIREGDNLFDTKVDGNNHH